MGEVIVYTDGSGINKKNISNSGHGGCGFVIQWENSDRKVQCHREFFGKFIETTSARMEIFAVIKALDMIPTGHLIKIYTDNQYVSNTISNQWFRRWIDHQENKANMDLWNRFDLVHNSHVTMGSIIQAIWVRGHDGNYWNEVADQLAYKGRINNTVIKDDRNGIYTI